MVPLLSLWLPIVLSGVVVFVASSIIHMGLGYHRSDYKRVPDEDALMDAMRRIGVAPGDYSVPCPAGRAGMQDKAFLERWKRGPVALMTVLAGGEMSMTPQLVQWFIYSIVVGALAAYVAGRALGPGADYLSVFRFAGTTTFIAYAVALWHDSIWYKRAWTTTLKFTFDGLVYGLLTGGVFGWLWPD
jgi:hypothetical protein